MTKALIVGGGIAGAVTAMALRKAGIDSVVCEAYPCGADDVGAFLTIMNNGLDALRAIDAHEPVFAASFAANSVEFFSGTGKRLGEVAIGGAGVNGPRTLKRAGLYRVLHDEAARRGIEVRHGKRLVDAATRPDGSVVASFEDGSREEGDLLVGADGIGSATRRIIDASAPRPRFHGRITLCGYTRSPIGATPLGTYRMIYGKRAFFGCTTAPDGQTWWFTSVPGAEMSRAELAACTTAQWQERAVGLFARDRSPAADIIRTSDEIVGSNAYDIPSTPVWHSGSMIIVGDAAHVAAPNAGQGASMAIEDGVVLAQCLRDNQDVRTAFAAYEDRRRERVERLVATSAKMGSTAMPGPLRRILRDAVLPRVLEKGPRNVSDWLTKHHIDWDASAVPH